MLAMICPWCRGAALRVEPTAWECRGCLRVGPAWRGIADLRTLDDGYLENAADWEVARDLIGRFDGSSFNDLLERLFDLETEPLSAKARASRRAHIEQGGERVRLSLQGVDHPPGAVLSLGCGSGAELAQLMNQSQGRGAAGLDIAMRWLVLARKRLEEQGLSESIPLVCGCAEALPFASGSFALIHAGDVIEHVASQAETMSEAYRTLAPGGTLFLASPNRFSLAPEPHVHVWGVGLLPRAWMPGYVRAMGGGSFHAIRTLGLGEWRRLLQRSPFGTGAIAAPDLPPTMGSPLKRALALVYRRLVRTRAGQALLLRIGPLFHVVCRRSLAATSPAIHRATRRAKGAKRTEAVGSPGGRGARFPAPFEPGSQR